MISNGLKYGEKHWLVAANTAGKKIVKIYGCLGGLPNNHVLGRISLRP
jgi:hypothetical protein